jgi:ABC-type Fe3+-hydroxamate transport system substrate-binding protein
MPGSPQRIVSLVPSLTESLFDLGLGGRVVGVTDYCVHPASALAGLPRVGGTKRPRLADVLALAPDIVLANQEENSPETVETLQAEGVEVWVIFPRSVRDAIDVLWQMVRRFDVPQQGPRLSALETMFEWSSAASANVEAPAVFCPIWREPAEGAPQWWMTVNAQTYVSDLIAVCGGRNVFAGRERRYPLAADLDPAQPPDAAPERDTRYPRVPLAEVLAARPEVILLPSEPFAFSEADAEFWRHASRPDLPAAQNGRIHFVDGSLLTWHGTRLARALQELPSLFSA